MKLKECKVIPGVVIDVSDPKYIGRVKADSPGLFDSSVMNKEGMPWLYPLGMGGYQSFSKLRTGSKIWILTDEDYHEFWYWPMFELNTDTRKIISGTGAGGHNMSEKQAEPLIPPLETLQDLIIRSDVKVFFACTRSCVFQTASMIGYEPITKIKCVLRRF